MDLPVGEHGPVGRSRFRGERGGGVRPRGGVLRVLAVSRLLLPNVRTVQVSWVTIGAKVAQVGLFFGVNDFGSTMIEENVVASAGVAFRMSEEEIVATIRDAGFRPLEREGRHARREVCP